MIFLKEEDSVIRRDFEFRLEVFDHRLEEDDKKVSVMLKEVVLLMLLYEVESLMLRSLWLKLTLSFEEYSSDEEMCAECEVPTALSREGFLENAKEEESGSNFLRNSGEE